MNKRYKQAYLIGVAAYVAKKRSKESNKVSSYSGCLIESVRRLRILKSRCAGMLEERFPAAIEAGRKLKMDVILRVLLGVAEK